jgi:hypothetical protein
MEGICVVGPARNPPTRRQPPTANRGRTKLCRCIFVISTPIVALSGPWNVHFTSRFIAVSNLKCLELDSDTIRPICLALYIVTFLIQQLENLLNPQLMKVGFRCLPIRQKTLKL